MYRCPNPRFGAVPATQHTGIRRLPTRGRIKHRPVEHDSALGRHADDARWRLAPVRIFAEEKFSHDKPPA
jgi:hypothetical protein